MTTVEAPTWRAGLHDYQQEAAAALWNGWLSGGRRLAVVLPTGSGKTRIMCALAIERALAGERTVILVHRDELANQTIKTLLKLHPGLSCGIVKAGRNETHKTVVVASIQTLARPARLDRLQASQQAVGGFGLVACDEIHLSASDSWVNVMRGLGCFRADGPKTAGFTATMSRADSRGLGDIWEEVVFTRGIKWFIERGYLVEPVGKVVTTDDQLDKALAGAKKTAGDYNEKELGIRMADETIRQAIIDGYTEHAADRKGVLFAPTIDSANYFAEGLTEAGFTAEGVYASTPTDNGSQDDRKHIYERYEPGGPTQILVSCTALSTGWDAPWCAAAILARPTLHQGLFIQQVGRVLRPWPGKRDAIVLDSAGATRLHSLHALIELNETQTREAREDDDEDEIDDEGGGDTDFAKYRGPVAFEDVDLFAGTEARWQTTHGGVLFVALADRLIFIHPDHGSWRVGWCPKNRLQGGGWLVAGLTPEEALAWGGNYAVEHDPTIASRKSPWRGRPGMPSEKQLTFARSIGLDPAGMTKSALSDAMDIQLASRTLAAIGRK